LGNDRWSPYGALWSQPVGTMTSQGLIHRAGTTTWRLASSSATLLTVPRGDTQRDFAAAAAEDGIVLERQSLPGLSERGHLALPNVAAEARALLERIYIALGAWVALIGTMAVLTSGPAGLVATFGSGVLCALCLLGVVAGRGSVSRRASGRTVYVPR